MRIFQRYVKSEAGISLIEVIASLVIVTIVLISFYSFFINSATFNSVNDKNLTAMSLARQHAAEFDEKYNVDDDETWKSIEDDADFLEDPNNLGFLTKSIQPENEDYYIEYSIKKEQEPGVLYKNLRQVHIKIWQGNKDGPPTSETFLYHEETAKP